MLTRSWGFYDELRSCVFVMINPSLANLDIENPTVKKCIYYSNKFGQNKSSVVNIFPNVSTVPSVNKFSFYKNFFYKRCFKETYIYLAWGLNLEIKEWLKPLLKDKSVFALEMSKQKQRSAIRDSCADQLESEFQNSLRPNEEAYSGRVREVGQAEILAIIVPRGIGLIDWQGGFSDDRVIQKRRFKYADVTCKSAKPWTACGFGTSSERSKPSSMVLKCLH